jgi:hypothetical protein
MAAAARQVSPAGRPSGPGPGPLGRGRARRRAPPRSDRASVPQLRVATRIAAANGRDVRNGGSGRDSVAATAAKTGGRSGRKEGGRARARAGVRVRVLGARRALRPQRVHARACLCVCVCVCARRTMLAMAVTQKERKKAPSSARAVP